MKIKCVYFSLILSYRRNVRENAAVIQFSRRSSLSEPDTPTTQNCNYENSDVRHYQHGLMNVDSHAPVWLGSSSVPHRWQLQPGMLSLGSSS